MLYCCKRLYQLCNERCWVAAHGCYRPGSDRHALHQVPQFRIIVFHSCTVDAEVQYPSWRVVAFEDCVTSTRRQYSGSAIYTTERPAEPFLECYLLLAARIFRQLLCAWPLLG